MTLLEELETLLETRNRYCNGRAEFAYPLTYNLIETLREESKMVYVTCKKCGIEQPDLGPDVECPECGHGPMPTKKARPNPRLQAIDATSAEKSNGAGGLVQ